MSHLEVAAPVEIAALAAIQLLLASGLAGWLAPALSKLELALHVGVPCAPPAGKKRPVRS